MTMLEADRLQRMRAPARAARVEGGSGAQKSSQISTAKTKPGRSSASKIRPGAKSTLSPFRTRTSSARPAQRGPDDHHHPGLARDRGQMADLALDLDQQGVLHQQVIDGIAAQRQLGKHQQVDTVRPGLTDQGFVFGGIGDRVGDMDHRGGGGDADKAVGGGGVERTGLGQGRDPA